MAESASPEFVALQQVLAGRFSLIREIGRGGMGVVYLARDVALDRPVAIKLLPASMAGDAELRDRFLREARTAAQLSHPNIVPIHLVEERDGLVFFVMSLIEGESLGERVRRAGPLRSPDAVRLIQEMAWALAYAHGRGIVHRDVKPDNILIERGSGRALLADFGIARSTTSAATSLTTPGLILGSLQFMAPEQTDATAVIDGRADIYALGVTAFFAVTGRLPFEGEKANELIAAHLLEPAPPVASIATACPPKLAATIDRCLVKDPAARWATGENLADALRDIGTGAGPMPPSIRTFINALSGGAMAVGMLAVAGMWSGLAAPEEASSIRSLLAAMALFPLANVFVGARAVAIAGFTAIDVAKAAASERGASDGYTELQQTQIRRLQTQFGSRWGRAALGVVGLFELGMGIGIWFDEHSREGWKLALAVGFSAMTVWIGVELVGHALQAGPFKGRFLRYTGGNVRRAESFANWFWSSPPVRGLLRVAAATVRNKPVPVVVVNRPTEVVLASAAAEVFAGLPAAERAALAGAPDVVRALEAAAAAQRARLATLDEAIAAVGDAETGGRRAEAVRDLRLERDRTGERLRATVEAMENLRLDLIRLRAGIGSTAELNDAIEAARQVGQEIDYTLAGKAEVAQLKTPL